MEQPNPNPPTTLPNPQSPTPQTPRTELGSPGKLPLPQLPQELATSLTQREQRVVLALVAGMTWTQALDAARVPPSANLRRLGPQAHITEAADWLIRELMRQAGVTRTWITTELVALYRRSLTEGRLAFPTARGCLELLGMDLGMFHKPQPGAIPVSQVADLMRAVAARGRAPLILDNNAAAQPRGEAAQQSESEAA